MIDKDVQAVLTKMKADPDFENKIQEGLFPLSMEAESLGIRLDLPTAGQINESAARIADQVLPQPEEPGYAATYNLYTRATVLATELARYFDAKVHRRMELCFLGLALGGTGNILQAQKGGPKLSAEYLFYRERYMASGWDPWVRQQLIEVFESAHPDIPQEWDRITKALDRYKKEKTQST